MTLLLTLCASVALAQADAPKTIAGKPTVEAVKPALTERSRLVIRGTVSDEGPWEVSAKGELRETEPGKGTITLVLDVHAPSGATFKRNPQRISANVDLPALKDKKQGRYALTVESPSGEKLFEGVWRDGTVYFGVFQEPQVTPRLLVVLALCLGTVASAQQRTVVLAGQGGELVSIDERPIQRDLGDASNALSQLRRARAGRFLDEALRAVSEVQGLLGLRTVSPRSPAFLSVSQGKIQAAVGSQLVVVRWAALNEALGTAERAISRAQRFERSPLLDTAQAAVANARHGLGTGASLYDEGDEPEAPDVWAPPLPPPPPPQPTAQWMTPARLEQLAASLQRERSMGARLTVLSTVSPQEFLTIEQASRLLATFADSDVLRLRAAEVLRPHLGDLQNAFALFALFPAPADKAALKGLLEGRPLALQASPDIEGLRRGMAQAWSPSDKVQVVEREAGNGYFTTDQTARLMRELFSPADQLRVFLLLRPRLVSVSPREPVLDLFRFNPSALAQARSKLDLE